MQIWILSGVHWLALEMSGPTQQAVALRHVTKNSK